LERPFPAGRIGGLDYAVLDALVFHQVQLDARPKVVSSASASSRIASNGIAAR
jgi:hypothetical protein